MFVLGFEFFIGLLVGGEELPELKEVGQEFMRKIKKRLLIH